MTPIVRLLRRVVVVGACAFAGFAVVPSFGYETKRSGAIEVTARINVVSDIPPGARISADIAARLIGGEFRRAARSVILKRTGSKASATVLLPYSWRMDSAKTKIEVSIEVTADTPLDQSALSSTVISIPPEGTTTHVTMPASL